MTTYYSKDHEWISVEGGTATIGITAYAQEQLGDVVYVELPETGKALSQGDEAAVVESVKAASEVYAPIDGEVTAANDVLADEPAKVNEDPEGAAWFIKMTVGNEGQLADLMDEAAYKAYIETL
ncbi:MULTISPECIES: glycine cleavage system protein GcvH [Stappiaceae]|jgi:glycine cleavage system H protein|uniref:glycine cleavage system protein GcvH n=1 Tax=Stappiaceae TaxID=2821832 RepID=UPI0009299CD5|nr:MULTISPECIES: glycine cleavage system protein GcvH [unclassified Labrenzia]MBO9420723.1 glycine cleavage system protein GcvH [Labrenzia sp. R4_2]MBO9423811.1 glycine cleavage system protein GcvH [Labrenzia sp. R4_1]OJJ13206.1 glycine cleavage system protein H [Alphaproteobacteria bacterium AO1-B]